LKGDVLPDAETIPWVTASSAGSSITTDGTKVTLSTPTAGDSATIKYEDTQESGSIRWADGMFQFTINSMPTNAAGCYVKMLDGVRDEICAIDGSSTPYRFGFFLTNGSTTPIAASGRIETGGPGIITEHRLTWISDANNQTVTLFQDGLCVAQIEYDSFNTTSTKRFIFGDESGAGAIDLTVRDLVIGVA
jgi:hypothetical protein